MLNNNPKLRCNVTAQCLENVMRGNAVYGAVSKTTAKLNSLMQLTDYLHLITTSNTLYMKRLHCLFFIAAFFGYTTECQG